MENCIDYKGYIGTVSYSSEDEVFYGKVHGINDLVTFEGASVKELKTAFADAVDDYIATCVELNKEPDKSYKGSFNVRIPIDLHKQAAFVAAKQKLTLNEYVKRALFYAVNHESAIKRTL